MRRRSGYAINVQLRPGSFVDRVPADAGDELRRGDLPGRSRCIDQNELRLVEPGNEAEFTLKTYPGRIIKAKVDSIVWAQGQGQVAQSGTLPQTGAYPQVPGRFPVKLTSTSRTRELFLAAGADGHGAIYTEHVRGDPHPAHGDPARRRDHQLPRAEAALMRMPSLRRCDRSRRRSRRRWRAARSRRRRRADELRSEALPQAPLPDAWTAPAAACRAGGGPLARRRSTIRR